jgi:hypothetical protein
VNAAGNNSKNFSADFLGNWNTFGECTMLPIHLIFPYCEEENIPKDSTFSSGN